MNPWEVLRIYQGVLLRALPGRITKWVVLRPAREGIPQYGTPLCDSPSGVLTPDAAIWDTSITSNVDFAALIAMPGMFGLSGDIAHLCSEAQERLRFYVAFFKQWREFIFNSVAFLLTPIKLKNVNKGWVAIQLQDIEKTKALLFIYRLQDATEEKFISLRNFSQEAEYIVKLEDGANTISNIYTGKELINRGINVRILRKNNACVYSIVLKQKTGKKEYL